MKPNQPTRNRRNSSGINNINIERANSNQATFRAIN